MEAPRARLVARTNVRFLGTCLVLGLISCSRMQSEVGAVFDTGGGSGHARGGNSSSAAAGREGAADGPGGSGGTSAAAAPLPLGAPIYTRAERLTNSQFEHAAIAILGLPATTDLSSGLVATIGGMADFSNNERGLFADSAAVAAFEVAAEKAADLATGSSDSLRRLYAGADADGFVRQLGRRAFRRPLAEEEVTRYTGIFARGEELYGAGFASGAALVIRAMLESPSFLYRTELGAIGEPLSGYEIASKLSFWLLDTTPSDELLDDAAAGKLDDVKGLLAAARAMLEEPAAAEVMRTFHRELYRLDRLDGVEKVGVPGWSAFVNAEAKEASLLFFDRIFAEGLGVREILTSTRGFVGPRLAPLYGQKAPSGLEERELGQQRRGYFMQVPALMDGVSDEPATIGRAMSLARSALCLELPPPPPDTPPEPPPEPGQTNREQLASMTAACGGGCHENILNPLGFAFEGFDGMGVARELDQGHPVDASGSFGFESGQDSFADAAELMLKLANEERPYSCYGQKLASYGLQRDVLDDDQALITTLAAAAREGAVKDAVLALVADPSFRVRHEDLP